MGRENEGVGVTETSLPIVEMDGVRDNDKEDVGEGIKRGRPASRLGKFKYKGMLGRVSGCIIKSPGEHISS